MSTSSFRHAVAGLIICIVSLALVGCGGGSRNLDGFYHGVAGGPITNTIKRGKAAVRVANEQKTLPPGTIKTLSRFTVNSTNGPASNRACGCSFISPFSTDADRLRGLSKKLLVLPGLCARSAFRALVHSADAGRG